MERFSNPRICSRCRPVPGQEAGSPSPSSSSSPTGPRADPPTVVLGVYNSQPGDTIPLGAGHSLRVIDVRDQGEDEPTVLAVDDMSQ
jgi:hypothetical protein